MKVYVVEYRDYDSSQLIGVFTSAAVAEKYIEQSIKIWAGPKADVSKYRARYSVSIEDVVEE